MMMMGERLLMPSVPTTTTTTTGATAATSTAAANSTAAGRAMDRSMQQQQEQQLPSSMVALKCPRCDSSNTKFCYYNNYSLSQPRHFCKACKRYWTRGGTLRNVPVGGGCRKNKRVKKPFPSTTTTTTTTTTIPTSTISNITSGPLDTRISAIPMPGIDPLMFGNMNGSGDMNFNGFAGFRPHAYDLQSQLNALGLGFQTTTHHHQDDGEYRSGIGGGGDLSQLQPSPAIQDYSFLGSTLSRATAASLLVSSLRQQPKKMDDYQPLFPYEDPRALENGSLGLGLSKEVKLEEEGGAMGNNRQEWQVPCENPFDLISGNSGGGGGGDASSSLYWSSGMNAWPDAANCGSSIAPLI